jgi:5-methylcytosine-specific restriction endonuclease McrA
MSLALKLLLAQTDCTFHYREGFWTGKCLICNGRIRFDARIGFGVSIEHIRPRSAGGGNDLLNLGLTHPRCNAEKGIHWDPKRRRKGTAEQYEQLVQRLLAKRQERWRAVADNG